MTKLRDDGDNAPAQTNRFEAVLDQRALVERANAKTKAAWRSVERGADAANATAGKVIGSSKRTGSWRMTKVSELVKADNWQ